MKQKPYSLATLSLLLCSCATGANEHFVLRETANKIEEAPVSARTVYQEFAQEHFDVIEALNEGNALYSPLDYFVASKIRDYRQNQGDLSLIDPFVRIFNASQQQQHESVTLKPALASTEPLEEKTVQELNDHYVSTFEGDIPSLKRALSKHYGREVTMGDPGEYYYSFLEAKATLYSPWEYIDDAPFYGEQTKVLTYAGHKVERGGYDEDEFGYCVDIPFLSDGLSFRAYVPKQGHSLSDLSSSFLTRALTSHRVFFHVPEFTISSRITLPSTGGYMEQSADIRLSRYGLEAKSFTAHGPTQGNPNEEIECWINRSFYFAVMAQKTPLFVGVYNG